MRVLIQRVERAAVRVGGETVGAIGRGLLVFVGCERDDGEREADWFAGRVAAMRLFPDGDRPWALDVKQAGGSVLLVSQFTLAARTRKGRRPSFDRAAPPERARELIDRFRDALRAGGLPVEMGRFGADMKVELVNDGPVTFDLDGPAAARTGP